MHRHLSRSFYTRNTLKIAQDLLGKFIVRKSGRKKYVGMIVETEAYPSSKDRASHAFGNKRTSRNAAEYLIGGHVYIYLVYGMYWQLNISTGRQERPECVLIRAIQPILSGSKIFNSQFSIFNQFSNSQFSISKKDINLTNGPGKLCRWLKLNKSFYGEDVTKSERFWLEDRGIKIKKRDIIASPRVNIDYAGLYWAKKPWRFYIKNSYFVSRAR